MENKIIQLTITSSFGKVSNTIHPILLCDDKHIVLVDCGFIGSLPDIEGEIKCHGLCAEQVTDVVLTHHDHDHMGAAAAFTKAYPHVKINASSLEEPYISAAKKPLRLQQAEERQAALSAEEQAFGFAFIDLLKRVEPVSVDSLVKAGDQFDWCGGCQIIATPGHTPGHISLYLPQQNALIAGDAIALEQGKPVIANPEFTLDLEDATRSLNQLLDYGAEIIYCYHGGTYTGAKPQE